MYYIDIAICICTHIHTYRNHYGVRTTLAALICTKAPRARDDGRVLPIPAAYAGWKIISYINCIYI